LIRVPRSIGSTGPASTFGRSSVESYWHHVLLIGFGRPHFGQAISSGPIVGVAVVPIVGPVSGGVGSGPTVLGGSPDGGLRAVLVVIGWDRMMMRSLGGVGTEPVAASSGPAAAPESATAPEASFESGSSPVAGSASAERAGSPADVVTGAGTPPGRVPALRAVPGFTARDFAEPGLGATPASSCAVSGPLSACSSEARAVVVAASGTAAAPPPDAAKSPPDSGISLGSRVSNAPHFLQYVSESAFSVRQIRQTITGALHRR
jgi:hypothetical protein